MYKKIATAYINTCTAKGQTPTFYGFIKFGKWTIEMLKMLFRYLDCCRVYNWTPSIRGMVLFDEQIRDGIRRGYTDAGRL